MQCLGNAASTCGDTFTSTNSVTCESGQTLCAKATTCKLPTQLMCIENEIGGLLCPSFFPSPVESDGKTTKEIVRACNAVPTSGKKDGCETDETTSTKWGGKEKKVFSLQYFFNKTVMIASLSPGSRPATVTRTSVTALPRSPPQAPSSSGPPWSWCSPSIREKGKKVFM